VSGSLRSVLLKLGLFTVITLSLTGLLAAVIGNIQPFTSFYDVRAEFSDATGLLNQDVVKVAGVTVGKVSGAEIQIDEDTGKASALVTMQVKDGVDIPRNARAAIKFRNLLGQRMIVISQDPDDPEAPIFPKNGDGLIRLANTSPAFDLGIVFNNLRPALRTLQADDVNTLSRALVKVFGGRESRIQEMVSDLADVTETLGARGPVVAELVEHLSTVASAVASRDTELRSIVDSLDKIVATLGSRSGELVRAADNLGVATEGTAEILDENRPGLDQAIAQLTQILAILADHRSDLDQAVRALPSTVHALNRATTYGEWVNLNGVCINGLCGPGFSTGEAGAATSSSAASPSPNALRSLLSAAAGGTK
jgi:phospholipid/cholesterol/gamma-HCH transport system substrate-binding protein